MARPGSRTTQASALALFLGLVCMRPLIYGESLSYVALGLALVAAALAVGGSWSIGRPGRAAVIAAGASWVWEYALLVIHPTTASQPFTSGLVSVLGLIVVSTFVLGDVDRRVVFTKLLVATTLTLCASAVVTVLVWRVVGVGSPFTLLRGAGYPFNSIGTPLYGVPIYAPFTPTYSSQLVFGQLLPRFLGLGRESGVGAAVIVFVYFMLPRVGWDRLRWKVLLASGLVLTQSPAGLGVALMTWVLTRYLITVRSAANPLTGYLRALVGVGLAAVAVYLAFNTPVIGVNAKEDFSSVSVDDRLSASTQGLVSVLEHPWGGQGGLDPNAGINLLGSLAQIGIPGSFFLAAGLLAPWVWSSQRRAAAGGVLAIFLTVATSQPPRYSTAFFVLALLAAHEFPADRARAHADPQPSAVPVDPLGPAEPVEPPATSTR